MHASPSFFCFCSHFPKRRVTYFITLLVSAPYSRSCLRTWSRETVSAVPSHVSFFCTVRDRIDTGTSDQIPGRTTFFSCAPENLVSRDGFGSPVPRQLFFVPSEIGSTRVIRYTERMITSRAIRLLYQRNAPVQKIRAIYTVLATKTKVPYWIGKRRVGRCPW